MTADSSLCLSGICIGQTIEDVPHIEWDRLGFDDLLVDLVSVEAIAEKIIGISHQDAWELFTMNKYGIMKSSLSTFIEIMKKMKVVCDADLVIAGSFKNNKDQEIDVFFTVQSNPHESIQSFEVTSISSHYKYHASQEDEWILAVKEKFPMAVRTYSDTTMTRAGEDERVIYFAGLEDGTLHLVGRNTSGFGYSDVSTKELAKHPECPRAAITID